ncbi:MAG: grasp-with-spasm system ATP-grasp peptide maturase [Bacteroidia bacterium]
MLVISSEHKEHSTDVVIDWLAHKGVSFIRVNGQTFERTLGQYSMCLDDDGANFDEASFLHNGKRYDIADIDGFWFRRTRNDLSRTKAFNDANFSDEVTPILWRHLSEERNVAKAAIFDHFKESKKLGNHRVRGLDKMETLRLARSLGLNIPTSLITGNRTRLLAFIEKHKAVITKPISEVATYNTSELNCGIFTTSVTTTRAQELPESFHPALFQAQVEKYCELRCFFMAGEFHTMAIFSQADDKTSVDFRNYNQEFSNPTVPFALPESIKEKLTILMDRLELDTGSIDIIYTPEKKYVFLEVNPVGQFGMVSTPCNFYIEKKIAEYFTTKGQ